MEFNCKYARPSGEVVREIQVGRTAQEVRERLQAQGFLPLEVQPKKGALLLGGGRSGPGFKTEDFLIFNQQFAALIRAGLPILSALDLLKGRIQHPRLQSHVASVRDKVVSGVALSEALESEGVFPGVYTASIYAGERSGNLVEVIQRYVRYEKTILSARKKFRNSLIYPTFLIVLSGVMVAVILGFVIPRFAELYEGMNTGLPVPTQVLIAVATAVQNSLILVVPLLLVLGVAARLWLRSAGGRKRLDDVKLKLPVVGTVWSMFSIAQLSRTLATLLQGGIPLVPALYVVRDASGNRAIADAVDFGAGRVREGVALSDALEGTRKFPDLALEMIRVGEQTGSLPEMLNHVADFYDEDVDLRIGALLGWVEPAILICVAVFVAAVLIALYLPILSIGSI